MSSASASRSRARSALAWSLSMTASTPTSSRPAGTAVSVYITGMPPPPAQVTTVSCSSSHSIGSTPKIPLGAGEGTTRRTWSPSGLKAQPLSAARAVGLGRGVDRADGLGRVAERGVVLVDLDHGQQGGDPLVRWEQVAELLLDQVADHALGLRAEDVQRVGVDLLVRRSLEREQTDLRAVAVRDDQLVVGRQRGERPACGSHVHTLVLCGQRLTPAEEGVAAQRDDDPHLSRPASRRALP